MADRAPKGIGSKTGGEKQLMYSDLLDFIDKFELSQDFSEDSSLYRIHAARVKETGATCLLLYLDGSKPALLKLIETLQQYQIITVDEIYKHRNETFIILKADFEFEPHKEDPEILRQRVFETIVRVGLRDSNWEEKLSGALLANKIESAVVKAEIEKRKASMP